MLGVAPQKNFKMSNPKLAD